jgi:two-component system CheB/CheR fusion protein
MRGEPQYFEWRHRRLDGSEFDVEMSLSRSFVGDTPFIVSVIRDITDRKLAEAAFLKEKRFSERVIDSLPGLFYLYDEELRLKQWNKNVEALGYRPDELSRMSMRDWFASDEKWVAVRDIALDVLRHRGARVFLEAQIKRKDGTLEPYLFSGRHFETESGPMILGVAHTIADRIRAENALAASERNYRELFEATSDALVIYDESGRVQEINERARDMFGLGAEEARHLSVGDFSSEDPPYSRNEALALVQRAVREGPFVFEWCSRRSDGTTFWSEIALRVSKIGGEQRIIASIRDITERKNAAMVREHLIAEVQGASAAKDRFLAMLSHELRNPLAAIQAGVRLLRRLGPTHDRRYSSAIDAIERSATLQARLVDDLLDVSRITRGKLTIRRAPAPVDQIVQSAAQTCQDDAARAGIALECSANSGFWVDVDGDRIQQVVINLIGNAIKFTPRGGRVAVYVTDGKRWCKIVVEDTGIGIEPKLLPKVFEIFQQGEIAAKRASGLGIGLSLVKSITELHGGRVRAESPGLGRGSRFIVELPTTEAPRKRRAA